MSTLQAANGLADTCQVGGNYPLSPMGRGKACPCCLPDAQAGLPILGLNGQGGTSHGQG